MAASDRSSTCLYAQTNAQSICDKVASPYKQLHVIPT
jgi:hypothetical protein